MGFVLQHSSGWRTASGTASMKRADIQGIRALAVVAVMVYHSGIEIGRGGFTGVDVFFVISGFVIAWTISREVLERGSFDLFGFAWRRFGRLAPALAVVVTITVGVSALVLSPLGPQTIAAATGLAGTFIFANGVIAQSQGNYFDFGGETNPLLHIWSLSVEEQFYVALPVVIALSMLLPYVPQKRAQFQFIVLGVLGAISFFLSILGPLGIDLGIRDELLGFYSPVVRIWEFLTGFLVFFLCQKTPPLPDTWATIIGLIGIGILVFSFTQIHELLAFPGPWAGIPVVGAGLLLLSGRPSNLISRLLGSRPLVWIGDRSYSLYLWHWPFVVFSGYLWESHSSAVVATIVSVIPALVSYKYVEMPMRQFLLNSGTVKRFVNVVRVSAFPVVMCSAVMIGNSYGWGHRPILDFQASINAKNFAQLYGCDNRSSLASLPVECVANARGMSPPIYLVGDSNAAQFSSGMVLAGQELGSRVTVSIANGCPFLDLEVVDPRPTRSNESCARYNQETLAFLHQAERGIVVISNSDIYWTQDIHSVRDKRESNTTMEISDRSDKVRQFRSAVERSSLELSELGHRVIFFHVVPKWSGQVSWDPSTCSAFQVFGETCKAEQSLSVFLDTFADSRLALENGASRGRASTWDPLTHLCEANSCSTHSAEFPRYRDRGHLSVAQSVALATPLANRLKEELVFID